MAFGNPGSFITKTAPTSPIAGHTLWIDPSTPPGPINEWTGSAWVPVGGIITKTQPTSPVAGYTFWFDANTPPGVINGYTGSQWIALSAASATALNVRESDGAPNISNVTVIRVSNNTLTDNGGGDITITTGGGNTGDLLDYQFIVSSTDVNIISTTSFHDLNELAFSVEANATYLVDCNLIYNGGTTGDMKLGARMPSSCSVKCFSRGPGSNWGADASDGDLRSQILTVTQADTIMALFGGNKGGVNNNPNMAYPKLLVQNQTNAGTVTLQFGQNATQATTTTMYAGSYLEVKKVAF